MHVAPKLRVGHIKDYFLDKCIPSKVTSHCKTKSQKTSHSAIISYYRCFSLENFSPTLPYFGTFTYKAFALPWETACQDCQETEKSCTSPVSHFLITFKATSIFVCQLNSKIIDISIILPQTCQAILLLNHQGYFKPSSNFIGLRILNSDRNQTLHLTVPRFISKRISGGSRVPAVPRS